MTEEQPISKSEIVIRHKTSLYWIYFSIIITVLCFSIISFLGYLIHIGYFDNIIKQLQPQINNQYNIPERNITIINSINVSIEQPNTNTNINITNNILTLNITNSSI